MIGMLAALGAQAEAMGARLREVPAGVLKK